MQRPSSLEIGARAEALWREASARKDWRQFTQWADSSSHLTLDALMRALAERNGIEYGSLLLDDMWEACLQDAESALFAEQGQPSETELLHQYRSDDSRARLRSRATAP